MPVLERIMRQSGDWRSCEWSLGGADSHFFLDAFELKIEFDEFAGGSMTIGHFKRQ